MVLYAADSFDRADSTTSLVQTDGAGSLDPIAYVETGTWGISSNEAYLVNGAAQSRARFDTSQADVFIQATLPVLGSSPNHGFAFRYTNINNTLYAIVGTASSGTVELRKRIGGIGSLIASATGVSQAVNGMTFWVLANGTNIKVFAGGAQILNVTETDQSTATLHGLWHNGGGVSTPERWNDFSISSPPTTNIKTLDGLAYASTKTVNGLAIASVKTIDSLA